MEVTLTRAMVDVVIPAAGSSQRMNLPTAKQFLKVMGKHILAYTVESFHRVLWVRRIVVVAAADQVVFTRELLQSYGFTKVRVCAGNTTRHRSIHCGVKALQEDCAESDVVVIHDGARPFVPEEVLLKVTEAARVHGASGVTRPLVSTVIRGDVDLKLVESLDRRLYRNSEMPQAFQYGVIAAAYEKCSEDDLEHGTECLLLAMNYSHCHAKLVEGSEELWKVTYQKDIYSLESTIKERQTVVSILGQSSLREKVHSDLCMRLHQRNLCVVEQGDPANTFVVLVEPDEPFTNRVNLCSQIETCYAALPESAVKLGVFVLLLTHAKPQTASPGNLCASKKNATVIEGSGEENLLSSSDTVDEEPHHITIPTKTETYKCKDFSGNNITSERTSEHTRTSSNISTNVSLSCCRPPSFCGELTDQGLSTSNSTHDGESEKHNSFSLSLDCRQKGNQNLPQMIQQRLKKKGNNGCTVLQIVYSSSTETLGKLLDELIWQRGSYLDGQTLSVA
ncbi:D-ribitol-5-phosphate cytidylyltransferase [Aplysia californica]|uniref:D-ribitol-5-phosphate cytidylyltransferase n=1 Tax=Aplysia californica TaxID=6500 RepID=A0ABM0K6I8_APLCA|nr:D-ribitol-5-phosphate cytidylyltransferase [Aplysia californica]XP_005109903.1 D-ribitol-5-phosphate cytidylyltransferase [Aplysia californica]